MMPQSIHSPRFDKLRSTPHPTQLPDPRPARPAQKMDGEALPPSAQVASVEGRRVDEYTPPNRIDSSRARISADAAERLDGSTGDGGGGEKFDEKRSHPTPESLLGEDGRGREAGEAGGSKDDDDDDIIDSPTGESTSMQTIAGVVGSFFPTFAVYPNAAMMDVGARLSLYR